MYDLSRKLDIEMPITQEVYKTLFENKSARLAVGSDAAGIKPDGGKLTGYS